MILVRSILLRFFLDATQNQQESQHERGEQGRRHSGQHQMRAAPDHVLGNVDRVTDQEYAREDIGCAPPHAAMVAQLPGPTFYR